MKRIILPSLNKIEETLALLVDSAKYKQYIVELKSIYDETSAKLDDLDTKEKAETFLQQAKQELAENQRVLARTQQELFDARVHNQEAKELKEKYNLALQSLQTERAELNKMRDQLAQKDADIVSKQNALELANNAALDKLKHDIEAFVLRETALDEKRKRIADMLNVL